MGVSACAGLRAALVRASPNTAVKAWHTPRPVAVRRSEPPKCGATRPSFSRFLVRLPGLKDLFIFLFFSWKWATAEGRAVSRGTLVFIFLFCLHVYFSAGIKKRPRRGEGYTNFKNPPGFPRVIRESKTHCADCSIGIIIIFSCSSVSALIIFFAPFPPYKLCAGCRGHMREVLIFRAER